MEERPQVEFGKRSTHKVSQALYDQIRWNAVCGESCTHGVEPGKSWRSYQMLTYGYLVLMLMVNKEAQQNRTRTVSPAAIPSKANYRVKSKKHL